MPWVKSTSTGEPVFVVQEELEAKRSAGEIAFYPGQMIPVTSPSGVKGVVPAEKFDNAMGSAMTVQTETEAREQRWEKEFGDDELQTFGEGVASGVTLGLYDVAAPALGASAFRMRQRREHSPKSFLGGEIAGVLGTALVPGGQEGAVAKIFTRSPAGLAIGAGKAVEKRVLMGLSGLEARSATTARVIGKAAQGATEGALYGAGAGISETALSPDPATAEAVFATVVSSALHGGEYGGAIGGLGGLGGEFISKLRRGKKPLADAIEAIELESKASIGKIRIGDDAVSPLAATEAAESAVGPAKKVVKRPPAIFSVAEEQAGQRALAGGKATREALAAEVMARGKGTRNIRAVGSLDDVADSLGRRAEARVQETFSRLASVTDDQARGMYKAVAKSKQLGRLFQKDAKVAMAEFPEFKHLVERMDSAKVAMEDALGFKSAVAKDATKNLATLKGALAKNSAVLREALLEYEDAAISIGRALKGRGYLTHKPPIPDAANHLEGLSGWEQKGAVGEFERLAGRSAKDTPTVRMPKMGGVNPPAPDVGVGGVGADATGAYRKPPGAKAGKAGAEPPPGAKAAPEPTPGASEPGAEQASIPGIDEPSAAPKKKGHHHGGGKKKKGFVGDLGDFVRKEFGRRAVKMALGGAIGSQAGGTEGAVVGALAGAVSSRLSSKLFESAGAVAKMLKNKVLKFLELGIQPATRAGIVAASTVLNRSRFHEVTPNMNLPEGLSDLEKAYHRRVAELRAAQVDMMATQTRIHARLFPLWQINPHIADDIEARSVKFLQQLWESAPKDPGIGSAFQAESSYTPSVHEITKWAQSIHVRQSPGAAVDLMMSGDLFPSAAAAFRETWPEMFQLVREEITYQLGKQKKPLTYEQTVQLSILIDEPLDSSLRPEFVSAQQAMYITEPETEGGTTPPPAKFGSLSKQETTLAQRVSLAR